jgi:hypothetical protein
LFLTQSMAGLGVDREEFVDLRDDSASPLVSCPSGSCHKLEAVVRLRVASDAGQDLVRGFGPNEGLGIFIVYVDEFADGRFQVFDTTEHASSNSLVREFGESSLHQVDPGSVGGSEVDRKPGRLANHFRMVQFCGFRSCPQ